MQSIRSIELPVLLSVFLFLTSRHSLDARDESQLLRFEFVWWSALVAASMNVYFADGFVLPMGNTSTFWVNVLGRVLPIVYIGRALFVNTYDKEKMPMGPYLSTSLTPLILLVVALIYSTQNTPPYPMLFLLLIDLCFSTYVYGLPGSSWSPAAFGATDVSV
jgi:hypothetical protein